MKTSSHASENQEIELLHFIETYGKLRIFSSYSDGWDLGRGAAINTSAIKASVNLLIYSFQIGLWRSNAFPSPSGGIMFTITQNDHDLEIETLDGKQYSFICEVDGEEIISEEDINLDDVKSHLDEIANKICLSEPLTLPSTTTETPENFEAPHSHLLQQTAVFRSSTMNAQSPLAKGYVSTSPSSTQMLEAPQPYFGVLQTERSLEPA
jgi:hypothetical protein